MRYQFEYHTKIKFETAVTQHVMRLRCQPAECYFQHVEEEQLTFSNGFWHQSSIDGLGNKVIQGGIPEAHDLIEYTVSGVVNHTAGYVIPESTPSLIYRLPTALTQFHDEMRTLLPSESCGFLDFCNKLRHNVYLHMTYTPHVTSMATTAQEAFDMGNGVCQDYAHLMVALCRKAGIAARYACGFIMGEGATHAWVEAHDGNAWYAFDPTNDTAVAFGYIKVAHGRDAHDCMVNRGRFTAGVASSAFTPIGQTTDVTVKVKKL